jgi:hypothetical protein
LKENIFKRGAIGAGQQWCPLKEKLASWVRELWQHNCTHQLSLKLDINENEWSKNLPMSGENEAHKRHLKTHLQKKTSHSP